MKHLLNRLLTRSDLRAKCEAAETQAALQRLELAKAYDDAARLAMAYHDKIVELEKSEAARAQLSLDLDRANVTITQLTARLDSYSQRPSGKDGRSSRS